MGEVYTFLECEIYKCGTTAGGTTPYSIDGYAEDVTVGVSRELTPRTDDQGVVRQRVPVKTEAQMSIGKLYAEDLSFVDGNSLRLVMGNALGTETWEMGSAYWQSKGWSAGGDGVATYDVSLIGNSFGTI